MKIATLLILVSTSLAGCVVVPFGEPPGVYAAPIAPAVVIRPYGYGYDGGRGYRGWR